MPEKRPSAKEKKYRRKRRSTVTPLHQVGHEDVTSTNGAYNYRYGVHGETDNAVEIFHQQKGFGRCRMARR
jgi:hypothetical protein